MTITRKLFRDPRSRKFVSTPYQADFDEYISPADVRVVDTKPKQQNQPQKFNALCNSDGSRKPQWWTQTLGTLRDFHSEVVVVNQKQLPSNNRYTGKTRSAYRY